MNTLELREMFEDDHRKLGLNLDRNKLGMYTNKTTRDRWLGYKQFFESHYRIGEKLMPMVGRYILGTDNGEGKVLMSRNPYRHSTRHGAVTEATRLTNEYGRTIYLFRCHEIIQPIPKEEIQ